MSLSQQLEEEAQAFARGVRHAYDVIRTRLGSIPVDDLMNELKATLGIEDEEEDDDE